MVAWLMITITALIALLIKKYISSFSNSKSNTNYPPGPTYLPIITPITWLRKTSLEAEATKRLYRKKYGPIVTLPTRSTRLIVCIFTHELAHQALIQNGSIFADRPNPLPITKILSSDQHTIVFSGYGPLWRLLRRNLSSMILHPSKLKDFSFARKWVLDEILIRALKSNAECNNGVVKVVDHFRFGMFSLLVFICFGDKLDAEQIKEIERVHQQLLFSLSTRFRVLNVKPWLTKILLKSRWDEFFQMTRNLQHLLTPHINARKELQKQEKDLITCYVDTLLKLEIKEDGNYRKLSDEELLSNCGEFLTAGTDTTATSLQWIMANLVKYPNIQTKLYEEIKGVLGGQCRAIEEDDLSKMPYLKAVVLEGLRRHPPGHFVLPHAVTKDAELGGYIVPKNAVVNFTIAEMGWDPKVWEDPMEFKPERFVVGSGQEEFDLTGSREIKMMPFGVGRRICPGLGVAMLHVEYVVANLILNFEWSVVKGHEVDLTEKQEFTIVMKNPLVAHISPRIF